MAFPVEAVLFAFLIAIALVIARQRDLFSAAMLTGIFSLLSAGMFTLMDAVDVAFTEAAVGAGISTVLILATLSLTVEREAHPPRLQVVPLIVVAVTGAALIFGTLDMPEYGSPEAPIHQHVAPRYIHDSAEEIGIPNIVTSVLASYRGYDTLGELTVVFAAGVGVILLLGSHRHRLMKEPREVVDRSLPGRAQEELRMRDMVVLRTLAKFLVPVVLLFAMYVQAHGDYGPGGGFQAGVIFAAGLMLYGLIFGPPALRRVAQPQWIERGIALGVLLYGGVGLVTLLLGGRFLEYSALNPVHPTHGQHLGILLVELGVGITVTCVMLTIYFQFAGQEQDA